MAEKLSNELFNDFNWERVGPMNKNWACADDRHKAKTHPSDIVFFYESPYARTRTYITCDLKSYAKGSITALTVHSAVASLARALACAEKSSEWQDTYVHPSVSPEICGLLFVYNHDGEYDSGFQTLLRGVNHSTLEIPKGTKLVVFGPSDIFWLNNIRYDIVHMRGTKALPEKDRCRFHYPNLDRKKMLQPDKARAATLEMLTAPWVVLEYQPVDGPMRRGFLIYYRPRGEHIEEFLYLLDYLLHYQIPDENTEVHVKSVDPHPNSHTLFGKAIDQYIYDNDAGPDLKARLERITFSEIDNIHLRFSAEQIGMEHA
jgi:hypothetical protein